MTKKILAVLLSVALVVSLLPATIFATENDCPVLDEHEGYNDHSKAHCDAHGVGYNEISTVAPECGQDGYTLYQCACGAYFMDDIIPMDDHYSEADPTEVVEPTCTSTGMVPVYTCDNCGDKYILEEDVRLYQADENGVIAKLPHTFETEYPTNDCTASESVCDVCGAKDETHEPEEEHSWVYNDPDYYEVVKAPTYHEDGVIKFYCTNEGCSQYKAVAIKAVQPHTAGMKKIAAVEPDCKNTGNIEYWKDEVCGKLFIETNEGLVEVTEEDVFLDYAHDWNQDPTIIEPGCETWGFSYYGCPTCGAKKDFKEIDPLGHTPYACPDHEEYDPDAEEECEVCYEAYVLSYDHDHTAPTCLLDGEFTWICGRCDEEQSVKDPKTGHKKKELQVPGTHLYGYSYTIVYCENEYCDKAAVETVTKTIGGQSVVLDVTVDVRNGDVYDMPAGSTRHVIEVKNAKAATTNLKHFFIEDKEVQAPTCTEPGKAFWYCAGENGCNTYYDEILDPNGHDYSDETNDLDATCTENAFEVCEVCEYEHELKNTKLGHDWQYVETTLPTCTGDKGYDWYECGRDDCDETDKSNETSFTKNKTYLGRDDLAWNGEMLTKEIDEDSITLTAKEEFELEHPGFDGTYEEYRAGDCLNNGYWKATCPDCDKTYLVLIDGTGKGHSFTDYVDDENATCTENGTETAVCDRCEEEDTREIEDSALGHDFEGNYVYNDDATCQANGTETAVCGRDDCEEKDTREAEDTMLEHNYEDNAVEEEDECETPGFIHYECTLGCGKEYVDGYVDEIEHEESEDVEHQDPSCTVDGYDKYHCVNCDEYERVVPIEATGHKNAAGETITDICTDTVTDRVCVNDEAEDHAGCPLTANNDGEKVVGKSHDIERITVYPGCEHYGYYAETCANGCGTQDLIDEIIPPHGHRAPWGESYFAGKEAEEVINENVINDYLRLHDFDEEAGESYTAPTYEALGSVTFICTNDDCGDLITRDVIRTGVDFIMNGDNAAVSGAYEDCDISDGDVLSVEITLNAYQTMVWGFNFDVDYNASGLNFLGYTYNAGDVFANYKVNNILTNEYVYEMDETEYGYDFNGNSINDLLGVRENANGTIKISAYTENDINGKAQDALITGTQSVITLYFQVEAKYEYTYMGVKGYGYDYDVHIDMEKEIDDDEWVTSATVVNSEGEVENEADYIWSDSNVLLDINYSEDVTITDLYICNMILSGEAEIDYLASADANKDGQITITDLDLMNQLLQGADESVIYGALAWAAPEGFVAA